MKRFPKRESTRTRNKHFQRSFNRTRVIFLRILGQGQLTGPWIPARNIRVSKELTFDILVKTLFRMPNCPRCSKPVYFAERVTSLGKDWHRPCLKCEKCGKVSRLGRLWLCYPWTKRWITVLFKTLNAGGHSEHDERPYCNRPCYAALFGPKGFGRGGAESHVYN